MTFSLDGGEYFYLYEVIKLVRILVRFVLTKIPILLNL
jgi:hypothetical protein